MNKQGNKSQIIYETAIMNTKVITKEISGRLNKWSKNQYYII